MKNYIYITLLLCIDHQEGLALCKLWEHPFSVPDLVSSTLPPPPPPGPILLEKGCGQQEGINGIGKQSLLWTSWMLTIGDAEALQSSSWWSSQPKPSKLSNDVIWVVFEGRFLERRIQLQWNRNTSASKGIFREWWFRAVNEGGGGWVENEAMVWSGSLLYVQMYSTPYWWEESLAQVKPLQFQWCHNNFTILPVTNACSGGGLIVTCSGQIHAWECLVLYFWLVFTKH